MAEPIGALRAELSLGWASFEQGFQKAAGSVNNFAKTFKGMERDLKQSARALEEIAKPIAAAMTVAAGAIAYATYKLIDQSSALVDLSDKSGLTIGWLEKTGFAAQQAGSSIEEVVAGTVRLQRAIGEGTRDTVEAVTALGLSFEELKRASPDQQMQQVLVALGNLPAGAERTTVAIRLLGKSGADLLPLANDIEALQRRAEELGLVMGDRSRRNAEALGDSLEALKLVFGGLANQIVSVITDNAAFHALINGLATAFGNLSRSVHANKAGLASWVTEGALLAADGLLFMVKVAEGAGTVWDGLVLTWKSAYNLLLQLSLAMERGMTQGNKVYDSMTQAQRAAHEQTIKMLEAEIAANSVAANQVVEGGNQRAEMYARLRGELEKVKVAVFAAAGQDLALGKSAAQTAGQIGLEGDAARKAAAELLKLQEAQRKVQIAQDETWLAGMRLFEQTQLDITEANLWGVDQRIFQIERERDAVLASIQQYAFQWPALYEELVAVVRQKYSDMTAAAQGHFSSVERAMAEAGYLTISQAEANAARTKQLYEEMKASGIASVGALRAAEEAAAKAKQELDGKVALNSIQKYEMVSESISGVLRSVFGKNKAAAIAAAIIDTAAAIVKVLAQLGWWGIPMAAAMAAKGYAQVQQIRNTNPEGFATGTPGMSFVDFGAGTPTVLHGPEAVITEKQGRSLADMLSGSIKGAMRGTRVPALAAGRAGISDTATLNELRALRAEQRRARLELPSLLRDAVMLAMA